VGRHAGDVLAGEPDQLPRCGRTRPLIARSVVVLPAPLAPISVTTWPSSTAND
jgi:hypothetical protein